MASINRSFLDDLTEWLRCSFCAANFTRQKHFLYLTCRKITCIDCALKMRHPTDRNAINCVLCNEMVRFTQIHENMPPQIRPLFQNTERLFQEYVRITDEQERWQELANESLTAKVDREVETMNDLIYRVQHGEREIQHNTAETARFSGQVAKVIRPARIQQLLQLSDDQIGQLNYDQLIGSNDRPRHASTSSRSQSSRSTSNHAADSPGALTQMMNELDCGQRGERRNSREERTGHGHRHRRRSSSIDHRDIAPQKIRHHDRRSLESRGSRERRHSRESRGAHGTRDSRGVHGTRN